MATNAPTRMKKLINKVEDLVPESLAGLGRPIPTSSRSTPPTRSSSGPAARSQGKVGLVSGGGSGHEPLHGGFVGLGMLDAAGPATSSPRPSRTRWRPRPAPSTAAPASSTSSRTTPATS